MISEAFKDFLAIPGSICTVLQLLWHIQLLVKMWMNDKRYFCDYGVLFITGVYLWSIVEEDKQLATKQIGFLSCGFTILFFASPLTMLVHLLRVKTYLERVF
ncbi:uncharacterized protein LOC130675012 [Microplitis mediator]|uniref:uncharacterized protein LOC130675012 n=1 Tax=Microplitis mediator TaxID=375433 RepID=UPI00255476EF|nr:uncharacterized protein LOC130675012 [Microplitis mediator]